MSESWKIKFLRWRFNWYPAYRRCGARITRIAEDMTEIDVRLPLNRATRNIHGTIYGGAIYSALDPLHAVMVAAAPTVAAEPDGPATARQACGKRVFIALWSCMDRECERPRYRDQPECVKVLETKRSRGQ